MPISTVAESMKERLYHRDPVFSFEFFPPKDETGRQSLERSMAELAELRPAFVSVTCGAAGSTRDLTRDLVAKTQQQYSFGVMAHITATGYARNELVALICDYHARGIRNFLALKGDPPRDQPDWQPKADQPHYAAEVVRIIRDTVDDVAVGVAGYPETHPDAESPEQDLSHLKEKVDAGADFVITQMFFDNDVYFNFSEKARRAGVKVPILPGLMPITRAGQSERFQTLCRVAVPEPLNKALALAGDSVRVREVGVSYAAAQAADLLHRGAPGVHFYTLNQSRACHTIFAALQAMGW